METVNSGAANQVDEMPAPSTAVLPITAPPSSSIDPTVRTSEPRSPWQPSMRFERFLEAFIVVGAVLAVLVMLDARAMLFNPNTATGGDMGAHVWTGDFVWRKLLGQGRLTGWSDDWFAGFPVLGFYFPLPFWIMTALNVVLPYNTAFKIVTGLGLVLYPITGWAFGHHAGLKKPLPVFMALATLPYMVDRQWSIYGGNFNSNFAGEFSFTLSMACALLFLGLLVKVMRTGQRRGSAAMVLAMVGLSHLLPTIWVGIAGTIVMLTHLDKRRTNLRNAYGVFGVASALAGGLWFAGFHRLGIVVATLVALCSYAYDQRTEKLGLGQFGDAFATVATGTCLAMFWIWPFWNHLDYTNDMGYEKETRYLQNLFPWLSEKPQPGSAVFFFAFVAGLVGAGSALWAFGQAILRARQANPNGWHSLGLLFCALTGAAGTAALWPWLYIPRNMAGPVRGSLAGSLAGDLTRNQGSEIFNTTNVVRLGTFCLISLVMAVLVFAWEVDDDWNRLGVALTIVTALCGVIYRVIPFGFRLWNNRVLPFWLMGTFLLAGMGVYAVGEFVVRGVRLRSGIRQGLVAEHPAARVVAMLGAVVVTHAAIALPLGAVPGSFPAPKFTKLTTTTVPENGGTPVTTQVGSWLVGLQRADDSADFNQSTAKGFPPYAYQGYENLGANWVDYSQIIEVMKQVGVDHGCGRAQWEAEGEQRRWGTSMALMLLPYWTDSCIGSMEGLYFESSPTTPYHWMNTSLLSKAPSNPQRELPYQGLNVAEGVKKLQQWGVRYYMAFSPAAIAQADQVADLQLLKTAKYQRVCLDPEVLALSCPSMWKIYLVQGSEIVEALRVEPAVVNGTKQNQTGGWLDLAAAQYSGRVSSDVPFAADGPTSWQRIQVASSRSRAEPTYGNTVSLSVPTATPLPRAVVSNVVTSFSGKAPKGNPGTVSFTVDKVGVPVVIKMSYFPNFRVKGADGPYRLAPNMMVVVPTANDVSMTFNRDRNDYIGIVAGLGGLSLLLVLRRQDRRRWRESRLSSPEF